MRDYPAANPAAPVLVLGHGAGAGHDHPWIRHVATILSSLGVRVVTFDFPYVTEQRKIPDRGDVLEAAFQAVWDEVRDTALRSPGGASGVTPEVPMFAGGKSMGGRIASQAAACHLLAPPPAGLVFFGYPLHPPGKAEQRRDRHLSKIAEPMLFLHGTRDPFGSPAEMTGLVETLPGATLHLVPGGDHSLQTRKGQDPSGASLLRAVETAAVWMVKI